MPGKQKQSSVIARFFRSKSFIVSIILVVLFVLYGFGRALYQDYKIKQEIRELQDEIRSLETKRLESLEILEYVMSDSFVEREARQSLNLKEPGEQVYVLNSTTEDDVSDSLETEDRPRLNNPTKWWYYFTHTPIDTNT